MPRNQKLTIRFEPEGRIANEIVRGTKLLDIAMKVGVGLRSECGGKGSCKKCLVHPVNQEILSPLNKFEIELLGEDRIKLGLRLACQASVMKSGTVVIPRESRTRTRQLQMVGIEITPQEIEPLYYKIRVSVPLPTLEDQRSDFTRIREEVSKSLGVTNVSINERIFQNTSPNMYRNEKWTFHITLKGQEIVEITPESNSDRVLGIAIDIGTSKIVGHLVDLITGKTLAVTAIENPQLPHGEDVISRISFACVNEKNLSILKNSVVEAINERIIDQVVKLSGVNRNDIYSLMTVGNTTMQHLLLGINPINLGRSPYVPVFTESVTINARDMEMGINPSGTMTVFPSIGGVIGGDCVAVALATGMDESDSLNMAVDVGTNTEIILGSRNYLTATSCASGPAFEGYHIHDGMKAVDGAIEQLKIDPETHEVEYQVIGDLKPSGICGSAIIDCLAELLKVGLVDHRGRLDQNPDNRKFTGKKKNRAFIIANPEETATANPILFTQEDVRNIQLAKAAVLTGAYFLMKNYGINEKDIRNVYLAGAFGNHVDPVNAKMIGLLPDFSSDKLKFVGNAAVSGAKLALLSKKAFYRAENIAKNTKFLKLALEDQFQQEYASAMYLPHQDMYRFPSFSRSYKKKS
ncbi:MAG: ASKHA domain-containing protein [Candidatus Hodarchaeales archaeon]